MFNETGGIAECKIATATGWGVTHCAGRSAQNDGGYFSLSTSKSSGYAEQVRINNAGLGVGSTPAAYALHANAASAANVKGMRLSSCGRSKSMHAFVCATRCAGVALMGNMYSGTTTVVHCEAPQCPCSG